MAEELYSGTLFLIPELTKLFCFLIFRLTPPFPKPNLLRQPVKTLLSVSTLHRKKVSQHKREERIMTSFCLLVDAEIPGKTQEEKNVGYHLKGHCHIMVVFPWDSRRH